MRLPDDDESKAVAEPCVLCGGPSQCKVWGNRLLCYPCYAPLWGELLAGKSGEERAITDAFIKREKSRAA